jgi:quinoprotein glucose dehydrogenase
MAVTTRRFLVVVVALLLATRAASAQTGTTDGEWRFYNGDAGSTRYAPFDQINQDTVADLGIAWRWTPDHRGPRPETNYQATPLMVGGVLYVTAGTERDVVAIDAASGVTRWVWRYNEGPRGEAAPRRNHRGVAYWSDGDAGRVVYITPGFNLISLDAQTGLPDPRFGLEGIVDLYDNLDRPRPRVGAIGSTSPPIIVGDVIVVGSAQSAFAPSKENPTGFVRGYDIRTGERRWIFHTIPVAGEFGNETWENDSWSYTGNAGVWAPMSADRELGYVYLPIETATNDTYGGDRPGDNLFAESVVCLDAATGERVWHFQFVHHGVWDWDTPNAPILLDITVDGRPIKALAQATKQAWLYVLDRETGDPVWPIEERAVPQTDVPGEQTAPTQPFPTRPAAFDRQGLTHDDLIDFTPELRAQAVEIVSQYRIGPIFTPPIVRGANGLRGTLILPGLIGGANWQGAAADAETGVVYVPSITHPMVYGVTLRDAEAAAPGQPGGGGGGQPARIAPSGCGMMGPQGLPLTKPPYGRITAIDLRTGDHLWMVPNGETPDCITDHPALAGVDIPMTGRPERGGIIVTKALVFAGEGSGLFAVPGRASGGPMFRAYDKATGAVVSELELPAHQTGIPMTYMLDGTQYIVMAIGNRDHPAELVALTVQ